MSKIICDVCGTRYPESAEQCPICGCIRAAGASTAADTVVTEEAQLVAYTSVRGGRFSKSNVRKRNRNMARSEKQVKKVRQNDPEEVTEEYVEEKTGKGSGRVINTLLVVVIIALLLVTGYIFVQYFLPYVMPEVVPPATDAPTVATEAPTDAPTEEPTVPCTGLELVNGSTEVVLTEAGQMWLLNVQVAPADCTDELIFTSSDDAVATVDEQGCITAVGEGEATITVQCGTEVMEFDLVCFFVAETEPPTEAPTEEPTEAPTEAPTEPPLRDVKLEVNKTDMTFTMIGQQFQMKLKNGLTAQEVTWKSENEGIVTIDENGLITCVGWGTTNITVTYGDQEVVIICRCKK